MLLCDFLMGFHLFLDVNVGIDIVIRIGAADNHLSSSSYLAFKILYWYYVNNKTVLGPNNIFVGKERRSPLYFYRAFLSTF